MVSEWAAHCPDCGHSADDALEGTADRPTRQTSGSGADPYLDLELDRPTEEPLPPEVVPAAPPPKGRRRLARSAAVASVVLAVAAGTATGVSMSTGGPAGTQGLRSLYGEVVADTGRGTPVAYDPATGRTAGFQVVGGAPFTPAAVSPDGTTWLGSNGTTFTVAGSRVTVKSTNVTAEVSGSTTPAVPAAFADGDRAVLLLTRPVGTDGAVGGGPVGTDGAVGGGPVGTDGAVGSGPGGSPAEASVVRIADGRDFPLGLVDSAGGDPQSLGAFVAAPVDFGRPGADVPLPGADGDVELRHPGQPPQVLATASQLEEDVGWSADRPVQLGVYPSPSGDAVAVVLTPLELVKGDAPMVVLSRSGGVLAAVDDWSEPMYGTGPVWSPGGHQLAYPTYTTTGPALAIGSETGAIGTVPAPAGTLFGSCVWSVSSTDVVCQAVTGNRSQWLYAVPTSNRLLSTRSAGMPVAWVAAPLP